MNSGEREDKRNLISAIFSILNSLPLCDQGEKGCPFLVSPLGWSSLLDCDHLVTGSTNAQMDNWIIIDLLYVSELNFSSLKLLFRTQVETSKTQKTH